MFVHHQLGLAVHPHDPPVAGQEPEFGAKALAGEAGAREALGPSDLVVRVQLPIPEERVVQPFLRREAEQLLDLRTDIKLAGAAVEGCHEGHGGDLLHQGPIPGLRPVQLGLAGAVGGSFPEVRRPTNCQRSPLPEPEVLRPFARDAILGLLVRRSFAGRRFARSIGTPAVVRPEASWGAAFRLHGVTIRSRW